MRQRSDSTPVHMVTGALALLVAFVAAAVLAAPAMAIKSPDREVTVTPGAPDEGWDGAIATGSNQSYDSSAGEPCGGTVENYCDVTLLHVEAGSFWDTRDGALQINLPNSSFLPVPASDFDVYVYESNSTGTTRGALVDSSADLPGLSESVEIPEASGDYLVQVVYFAVVASRYSAETKFLERKPRKPVPPDIDDPPGLQDFLASDPALGFRSHSEPHIAQSPTNPNLLVAASKMYNRDPDSLKEYEFKVGSYVSFDGGRRWTDMGQTNVCPPEQAPPDSWPDENTCYPDEVPNAQGTGPEDTGASNTADAIPSKVRRKLEEKSSAFRRAGKVYVPSAEQRGSDFGEEYITSDPWVQFDDEGNAYLMVLDAPPFEHGNGWGMSFHRWDSVSRADVRSGNTWSDRIVINSYPNDPLQPHLLDDKNTFAINNAGRDRDGKSGTMVACWGQNVTTAIKQQTVCERSTDGGKTWPGRPIPISDVQQLVIGVSVVADKVNPDRFYATWLHYVPGIIGAPDELWFSQSLDGGQTWTKATPVTRPVTDPFHGVPRQFPGQKFRNLSIPMMAAGPREGELYITYADYDPASSADEDGQQADVKLVKSTTGGLMWSDPLKVNRDGTDADQFQPNLAVTPAGQVNVSYFDRRHDIESEAFGGNFHIDTFLSRSNDGGLTFSDTRVSHDMWDPEINPPVSPSGEFIGDYQGLVADDCFAIPFVNDTHLANAADRDRDFDRGLPRSRFQEVFSWRVPNTDKFGGGPVEGVSCERLKK